MPNNTKCYHTNEIYLPSPPMQIIQQQSATIRWQNVKRLRSTIAKEKYKLPARLWSRLNTKLYKCLKIHEYTECSRCLYHCNFEHFAIINTIRFSTHDASYNCHKTFYNKSYHTSIHSQQNPKFEGKKTYSENYNAWTRHFTSTFLSLKPEVLGSHCEGIIFMTFNRTKKSSEH